MRRSRTSFLLTSALGLALALSLVPAQARSQVWYQEWVIDGFASQGDSVAVDAAGNVLVLGQTFAVPGYDSTGVLLRKYDAAGNELWSRLIGASPRDDAGGVAVDSQGSVLVSGTLQPDMLSDSSGFLRKYDASGNLLWAREFGSSAYEGVQSIAVGPGDVVYWIGEAASHTALWKFDSSGTEAWTTQFAAPSGYSADPAGGGVDAAGNLYVSGDFFGAKGANGGSFLVKFSPDGVQSWDRRFSLGSSSVADTAVDADGNVRVAGTRTHPLDPFQRIRALEIGFVRTYGPDGDIVSTVKVHGLVPPRSMALDGAGATYLMGGVDETVLMKLDNTGRILWEEVVRINGTELPLELAVDSSGGLLVTGAVTTSLQDAFVMKVDQSPSCQGTANPSASEDGALSRPIHLQVEPAVGPLGPVVHTVNCAVVVRVGL